MVEELFPVEEAKKDGVELHFVNMSDYADPVAPMLQDIGSARDAS